MTPTKQQTTPKTVEKTVEAPKTVDKAESKDITPVEDKTVSGETLERIRVDMPLGAVKFKEYDAEGNLTGKVTNLGALFKSWAHHEEKGRSLSNTFASFALAVAETNQDLSADAQAAIFRELANKAADKVFPKLVAKDEYGYPLVDTNGNPTLIPTTPDTYKTMVSGIVSLWTGKGKTRGGKEKVEHDPIIPGKAYEIWDGRKGKWETRLVLTLGHMKAALRGMDKKAADKKEAAALKVNKEETEKTIALLEKEGFTDEETKGIVKKAQKASEREDITSRQLAAHSIELERQLTKRRNQLKEKQGKATSEQQATPGEIEAGKAVKPVVDKETGAVVPVDTETGKTPIEALDVVVSRHVSPEEAYKLQYLASLFAALEGESRKQLMDGLNALINTCLKANPKIAKVVKEAVEARRKAAEAA